MKAGRELDALIAEKIFGWKQPPRSAAFRGGTYHFEIVGSKIILTPTDPKNPKSPWCSIMGPDLFYMEGTGPEDINVRMIRHQEEVPQGFDGPEYSTDIAAAWQVVGEMLRRGLTPHLEADNAHPPGDEWRCAFSALHYADVEEWTEWESSAPHAICLAALRTLEKSND